MLSRGGYRLEVVHGSKDVIIHIGGNNIKEEYRKANCAVELAVK